MNILKITEDKSSIIIGVTSNPGTYIQTIELWPHDDITKKATLSQDLDIVTPVVLEFGDGNINADGDLIISANKWQLLDLTNSIHDKYILLYSALIPNVFIKFFNSDTGQSMVIPQLAENAIHIPAVFNRMYLCVTAPLTYTLHITNRLTEYNTTQELDYLFPGVTDLSLILCKVNIIDRYGVTSSYMLGDFMQRYELFMWLIQTLTSIFEDNNGLDQIYNQERADMAMLHSLQYALDQSITLGMINEATNIFNTLTEKFNL